MKKYDSSLGSWVIVLRTLATGGTSIRNLGEKRKRELYFLLRVSCMTTFYIRSYLSSVSQHIISSETRRIQKIIWLACFSRVNYPSFPPTPHCQNKMCQNFPILFDKCSRNFRYSQKLFLPWALIPFPKIVARLNMVNDDLKLNWIRRIWKERKERQKGDSEKCGYLLYFTVWQQKESKRERRRTLDDDIHNFAHSGAKKHHGLGGPHCITSLITSRNPSDQCMLRETVCSGGKEHHWLRGPHCITSSNREMMLRQMLAFTGIIENGPDDFDDLWI